MRIIKAAAVQLSPVLYSRDGTVDKICKQIIDLGRQGVPVRCLSRNSGAELPILLLRPVSLQDGQRTLQIARTIGDRPIATTEAIGEACKQARMVASIGVNERDGGTIYNTQLLFDADGRLVQHRRKISPTYHERMVWGQGDGSGLRAVDTAVGRIGSLACWEHYNPLARYALIADEGADPRGDVPWFLCRRPLLRADTGQHSPARASNRPVLL